MQTARQAQRALLLTFTTQGVAAFRQKAEGLAGVSSLAEAEVRLGYPLSSAHRALVQSCCESTDHVVTQAYAASGKTSSIVVAAHLVTSTPLRSAQGDDQDAQVDADQDAQVDDAEEAEEAVGVALDRSRLCVRTFHSLCGSIATACRPPPPPSPPQPSGLSEGTETRPLHALDLCKHASAFDEAQEEALAWLERQAPGSDHPWRRDLVLVDEAQDTSEIQWAVLRALQRWWQCRVVLVGDRHQQIYGFAGSRIEPFLQPERHLTVACPPSLALRDLAPPQHDAIVEPGGQAASEAVEPRPWTRLTLRDNYRCSGPVVRLLNRQLQLIPSCEELAAAAAAPLLAMGNTRDEKEPVTLHLVDSFKAAAYLAPLLRRWWQQGWRVWCLCRTHASVARWQARLLIELPDVPLQRSWTVKDPVSGATSEPSWSIGTCHATKGGEQDVVVLLDVDDRTWSPDRRDADENVEDAESDLRNTWYVACSRARRALHLVHTSGTYSPVTRLLPSAWAQDGTLKVVSAVPGMPTPWYSAPSVPRSSTLSTPKSVTETPALGARFDLPVATLLRVAADQPFLEQWLGPMVVPDPGSSRESSSTTVAATGAATTNSPRRLVGTVEPLSRDPAVLRSWPLAFGGEVRQIDDEEVVVDLDMLKDGGGEEVGGEDDAEWPDETRLWLKPLRTALGQQWSRWELAWLSGTPWQWPEVQRLLCVPYVTKAVADKVGTLSSKVRSVDEIAACLGRGLPDAKRKAWQEQVLLIREEMNWSERDWLAQCRIADEPRQGWLRDYVDFADHYRYGLVPSQGSALRSALAFLLSLSRATPREEAQAMLSEQGGMALVEQAMVRLTSFSLGFAGVGLQLAVQSRWFSLSSLWPSVAREHAAVSQYWAQVWSEHEEAMAAEVKQEVKRETTLPSPPLVSSGACRVQVVWPLHDSSGATTRDTRGASVTTMASYDGPHHGASQWRLSWSAITVALPNRDRIVLTQGAGTEDWKVATLVGLWLAAQDAERSSSSSSRLVARCWSPEHGQQRTVSLARSDWPMLVEDLVRRYWERTLAQGNGPPCQQVRLLSSCDSLGDPLGDVRETGSKHKEEPSCGTVVKMERVGTTDGIPRPRASAAKPAAAAAGVKGAQQRSMTSFFTPGPNV